MQILRDAFIRNTLEVYFGWNVKKIDIETLIKTEEYVAKRCVVLFTNGEKEYIRVKQSTGPGIEWKVYKSGLSFDFMPDLLFSMKTQKGEYVYFLSDFQAKARQDEDVSSYKDFYILLQSFYAECRDFVPGELDIDCILSRAGDVCKKPETLLYEVSCEPEYLDYVCTKKQYMFLELNFLRKHLLGYLFHSLAFSQDKEQYFSLFADAHRDIIHNDMMKQQFYMSLTEFAINECERGNRIALDYLHGMIHD